MKKNWKRLIALILVLTMVFSMSSVSSMAAAFDRAGLLKGSEVVKREGTVDAEKPAPDAVITPVNPAVSDDPGAAPVYPATALEGAVTGENAVSVRVEAPEGAFPAGIEMTVAPVSMDAVQAAVDASDAVSGTVQAAADITFMFKGQEIQPAKQIKVYMSSPALSEAEALSVVHLDANADELLTAAPAAEPVKATLENNEVVFEAEKFSVYAVIGTGEEGDNARVTVNFFGTDRTTPVATVYVKNSDELLGNGTRVDTKSYIEDIVYDPGVGGTLPSGKLFRGWSLDVAGLTNAPAGTYVGSAYTNNTTPMTIPEIRTFLEALQIAEGDVLNVYAMIYNVFNVTYKDSKGIVLASEDVLCSINETSAHYEIDQTYSAIDDTHNFDGWHVEEGASNITNAKYKADADSPEVDATEPYQQGTTMDISGNIVFSTEVSEGHWLVFEEVVSGATYNAPVFVPAGATAASVRPSQSLPANMKASGYTFVGWFTGTWPENADEPTYGEAFDFDQQLTDRVTIYAKWTMAPTTKVTLIVWKQSVVDDKDAADADKTYDFAFSTEINDVASASNVSALDLSAYQNKDGESITIGDKTYRFYGFKYNTTKGIVSKDTTVNPNGTTVVNLYYDRELVTYNYYVQGYTAVSGRPNLYSGSPVYFIDYNGVKCAVRYYDRTYTLIYEPTTSNTGSQYAVINGEWTELRYFSNQGLWGYQTGSGYSAWYGTRYKYNDHYFRTNNSNYTYYTYDWEELTDYRQTGLYGQKLNKYGYTWPTDYRWFHSQTGNTFTSVKDMFEGSENENPADEYVTDYYGRSETFDTNVYHYLQQTDGTYKTTPDFTIPTGIGDGMIFRTFQGFTASEYRIKLPDGVYTYQTGSAYDGETLVDAETHTTTTGWTDWLPRTTCIDYDGNTRREGGRWTATAGGIEFRYTRNKYDLTYMVGRFVNASNEVLPAPKTGTLKTVEDIVYESSMAPYAKNGANYFDPDEDETVGPQEGYVFMGWYIDETCTTEAKFDGTMPMDGMIVYGKWQQKQYRVFLHPNAGTDSTLDWGSETQSMAFRIDHGAKVSVPTGRRTGYEFLGWFTDEALKKGYNADTKLNDNTVPETPAYTKTEPTDAMLNGREVPIDKWGNVPAGAEGFNKDVNRPWILRKLDLYAKWSQVLIGADGIGVIYDANGGQNAPEDTKLYKDNVEAVAQAASTPTDDTQQFLYWVMQKWDAAAQEYVDLVGEEYHIYPGQTFPVLKDNARDEVLDAEHHRYTVCLRAEYGDKETDKPTHITWYANGGVNNKTVTGDAGKILNEDVTLTYLHLQINEPIPVPADGVFSREGFKFIGWARDTEPEGAYTETDGVPSVDESKYAPKDNLTLWLKLNADGTTYDELNADGTVKNAGITQVAADEALPYQAIYAVWESNVFYVFHSFTGILEAIEMPAEGETYDLTGKTSSGTLYGGYYSTYGGVTETNIGTAKTAALAATNLQAAVTDAVTYDGSALKTTVTVDDVQTSVRFWTLDDAYTADGRVLAPVKNAVYYLKEVPNIYLETNARWVYDWADNNRILKMYFLTVVDDTFYNSVGYKVIANDKVASLVSSFTYQKRNDEAATKIKPVDLIGRRGYLGVVNATESIADILAATEAEPVTIIPFWTTPDNVRIETAGYSLYCTDGGDVLTTANIGFKPNTEP